MIFVRRRPFGRIAMFVALGLVGLLLVAIGAVWIERRPIATHYLKGEFERRGVTASYHLDRVGLRTQEVSNLVIGDPKRPDLVARFAHIETRLKLNGKFEVYRIVARGVRLHGRLVHGRISWGQIDKMMPPPSNKPFALPDFALDVADSSISLATPFGPSAWRSRATASSAAVSPGAPRSSAHASLRAAAPRPTFTPMSRSRSSLGVRGSTARSPPRASLARRAVSSSARRGSMPRRASTRRSRASTAAAGWR